MADPISVDRLVEALEKLKAEMDGGKLKSGEYDQRLARVIVELRDRGLEADRTVMISTLETLLQKGTITPAVKDHLESRLGLK